MQKTGALILGVPIPITILPTDASAGRIDMVKLKDRSAATLYVVLDPIFPLGLPVFQGYRQITGCI